MIGSVTVFTLPGGFTVYAFPILLGLGSALGLAWTASRVRAKDGRGIIDAGLVALAGGLLGGRVSYVVVHWYYFNARLGEIPQIQLGGLSWAGAALGGVLSLLAFAALTHRPAGEHLDALLPLATVVAVSAWLGGWLDGVAYGGGSQGVPARDEWGTLASRFPVQLLGAMLTLGLLALLDWRQPRKSGPGVMALQWGLGFSMLMFGLSLLRADPAPNWLGFRLDAWAAIFLLTACMLGFVVYKDTGKGIKEKG
jgi:phosphatidylglycerol:prolipoprotein diacylglycerol transferase